MTPGRIIHVRIGGSDKRPELRPAIVTRANDGGTVNAVVFLDGANDDGYALSPSVTRRTSINAWLTSIAEGKGIGAWRWPERDDAEPARKTTTRKATSRKATAGKGK